MSGEVDAMGHLVVVRTTLAACLSNVDAAIAALGITAETAPSAEPSCGHPQGQRQAVGGLASRDWRCGLCGYEHHSEPEAIDGT
jgi:hypothetical protein